MPWSAKAQELLKQQYAPTGAAARAGLRQSIDVLKKTSERQEDAKPLLGWFEQRLEMAEAYVDSYRRYCCCSFQKLSLSLLTCQFSNYLT